MSNEKSTIEILTDFATNSNREIKFNEITHPHCSTNPVIYHKRTLYIPNDSQKTSFYVCYNDTKSLSKNNLYCGVFIPISLPTTCKMTIRKKDFLDRINPLTKRKSLKIGEYRFDSKVVISCNDQSCIETLLKNSKIQKLILESLNITDAISVTINDVNPKFVPELKEKSHLAIITKMTWISQSEQINKLFNLIENVRETLQKI
jgi:hypothetical protein